MTATLNDKWGVVILKGFSENGSKIWRIVSEHDSAEECRNALDRAKAEGFTAHLVHFQIETEY